MAKFTEKELEVIRKYEEQELIKSLVFACNFFEPITLYDKNGRAIKWNGIVNEVQNWNDFEIPGEGYLENPKNVKSIGDLEDFIDNEELCSQIESWSDEHIRHLIQYKNGSLFFIDFGKMHDEMPDLWDSYNPRR